MQRILTILALAMLAAGCGSSGNPEDGAKLEMYTRAVLPATELALRDLKAWQERPGDLALQQRAKASAELLLRMSEQFVTEGLPSGERLRDVVLTRKRGDENWQVHGEELGPAIQHLREAASTYSLTMMTLPNGRLDANESASLSLSTRSLSEAATELRRLLYREEPTPTPSSSPSPTPSG